MKKAAIRIFAVWLAIGIIICSQDYTKKYLTGDNAAVTQAKRSLSGIQDDIDVAANEWSEMENEKKKLDKSIRDLERSKKEVIEYIHETDVVLDALQARIDKEMTKIRALNEELTALEAELEARKTQKEAIYDTCQKRIQYVYENTDESYLGILLSSSDLSDFLNSMEYVEKITEFDKGVIEEYDAASDALSEQERAVEEKYADKIYSVSLLKEDRASVQEVIDKKKRKLKSYEKDIDTANENKEEVEVKIAAAEEEIENLLDEQREIVQQQIEEAGGDEAYTGAPVGDVSVASTGFAWPLPKAVPISSRYGPRVAPTAGASTFHRGVDLSAPTGMKILASKGGKVTIAQYSPSAGNYIGIYHGHGIYTYYMHCSVLYVEAGDYVAQGMVIGKVGSTGISTGPHLHFAVNVDGEYTDPLNYIEMPKG